MEFGPEYQLMVHKVMGAGNAITSRFSPEKRDAAFGATALELYGFQRRWNPPYRNFCGDRVVEDWKSIPAVPTAAFRDVERPLACFPIAEAEGVFETSGTTGETRGRHYFYEFEMYRHAIEMSLGGLMLVHRFAPSLLHMCWLPGLGGRSSLRFMFEHLSNRGPVTDLDFDRPVGLMGTALSFLHLFESGRCQPLPEGSWAMETGGYKGSGREIAKADLHAMFEEHLGVPPARVINEYGMTELSSQFYAVGVDGYHSGSGYARAVVRNPETGQEVAVGEPGYLTIYDLANIGSVMAIATQDIAIRREGGEFELVGRDPAALPRGCSRAADEFLSR